MGLSVNTTWYNLSPGVFSTGSGVDSQGAPGQGNEEGAGKDGGVLSPKHDGRMRKETTEGHFLLSSLKKGQSPSKQIALPVISGATGISIVSFSSITRYPFWPIVGGCMQGASAAHGIAHDLLAAGLN